MCYVSCSSLPRRFDQLNVWLKILLTNMLTECNKIEEEMFTPRYETHYVKKMTGSCTHRMKLRNNKLIQYPFETAMLTRKNAEKQNEIKISCRNTGREGTNWT
jgi:hypothetical protein